MELMPHLSGVCRVLLALIVILSTAAPSYSFQPTHSNINSNSKHISNNDYINQQDGHQIDSHLRSTALKALMTRTEVMNLQPEIRVVESCMERNTGDSSTVILAAHVENEDGTLDECEGFLSQKLDSNDFEAHILCPNVSAKSMDCVIAILHKLLLQYLSLENEIYEAEIEKKTYGGIKATRLKFFIEGTTDDEIVEQLESIGILANQPEVQSDGLQIKLSSFAPYLNEYSFRCRGTEQGNTSLEVLKMLSARRVPYDFSTTNAGGTKTQLEASSDATGRNVVSLQKQILPSSVVKDTMDIMEEIKSRQWLSANPDSVDGLPSLHLNLVTNGKALFDESDDTEEVTFPQCISRMTKILKPHLYNKLLPAVRKMTNSPTVEISDVFIRSYGRMDTSDDSTSDESGTARYTLSPHYDVTAYATCVMILDSTAANGKNGLYTVPPSNGKSTSNAALRRFFPLDQGDGVVHTYDILHGVDVDPKLNLPRTSLIVWFVDNDGGDEEIDVNQPWLLNPVDDIGEFVLGLASESSEEEDGSHLKLKNAINPIDLYLSSASRGNIFAMTTLGQMCDDELVPNSEYERLRQIVYDHDQSNPFLTNVHNNSDPKQNLCKTLANALWYHASILGGNRVAQVSLADELMMQYMMDQDQYSSVEEQNILLMASTLFTMALHQGYDSKNSLQRLMDVECRRLHNLGIEVPSEDFFYQPVVQVLMMTL